MCGRYIFYDEENIDILNLIRKAADLLPAELFAQIPLGEVFPGSLCFAGCLDRQKLHTEVMRWGIKGFKGGTVINARSESCFSSPFFRDMTPCALPASGYYEWSREKKKYLFRIPDHTMYLAGLYRQEDGEKHFVILTEQAEGPRAEIHDRQPVIFERSKAKAWCSSLEPMHLLEYSIQNRTITEA